ncbi:hypothetical protein [Motiliproteus sp. MSK22-1]|uniref:hypothetical protein n=1 Tax=Motiliproteus sp. MSK22-1 TaxID=1897630 RepID=UPI000976C64D|nr:hypothetical protein [Motiliproteus sp. MSK22-1]OMH38745.1 hypothetical protein BGP75_06035 [Motiliproteus sp. MSK22-1]
MKFDIPADTKRKAKAPHELFLTNMVGNHILWFVAALGVFNTFWQPLVVVPVISFMTIVYTIWRAKKSLEADEWFVMCHWQVAARRSKVFASVLLVGFLIAGLGWMGYSVLGMKKVAVMALVGGVGLLPIMVSVLVLIVMESDGMHQASSGIISKGIYDRFPNEEAVLLADPNQEVASTGEH